MFVGDTRPAAGSLDGDALAATATLWPAALVQARSQERRPERLARAASGTAQAQCRALPHARHGLALPTLCRMAFPPSVDAAGQGVQAKPTRFHETYSMVKNRIGLVHRRDRIR